MSAGVNSGDRKSIVILGAGFGGLTMASELDSLAANGLADVTLVAWPRQANCLRPGLDT